MNIKSSTEGDIVGVSDFLPNIIWALMFMEAHGDLLESNKLYQDNQSAMKIILNGKRSSRQKTKHMDNRYFWIKDRLGSKNIKVEYCPTEKMRQAVLTNGHSRNRNTLAMRRRVLTMTSTTAPVTPEP